MAQCSPKYVSVACITLKYMINNLMMKVYDTSYVELYTASTSSKENKLHSCRLNV